MERQERQKDRETEKQRDRETERQRDRETERQTDRLKTARPRERQTATQTDSKHPDILLARQTDVCNLVLGEGVPMNWYYSQRGNTAKPKKKCDVSSLAQRAQVPTHNTSTRQQRTATSPRGRNSPLATWIRPRVEARGPCCCYKGRARSAD